jgi:hypothetical protein
MKAAHGKGMDLRDQNKIPGCEPDRRSVADREQTMSLDNRTIERASELPTLHEPSTARHHQLGNRRDGLEKRDDFGQRIRHLWTIAK